MLLVKKVLTKNVLRLNGQSYDFFIDDFFIKHVSLGFNLY